MENRRILNWRNLSIIRRAQIIAGAAGALATIVTNARLSFPEHSSISNFLFQLGLVLAKPTLVIWQAFGNPLGYLLFVALEIVINSSLCVIVGILIGWVVRLDNKKQ
jgi:putative flippase GtrA